MKQGTDIITTSPIAEATPVDDRQLLEAILLSLVSYRAACKRFNERRKVRGFDYRCSKLLDQIALRKSMLQLLAAEARIGAPPSALSV